jgi:HK97 family phage major capsid protein
MDINARIRNYEAQIAENKKVAEGILGDTNLSMDDAQELIATNDTLLARIKSLKALAGQASDNALPYPEVKEVEEAPAVKNYDRADAMKAASLSAVQKTGPFQGETKSERALKAYRFGMWFLAGPAGQSKAQRWCKERGIEIKGHVENENEAGGFLVPEEFLSDLIDLREQYGVFRRNSRVTPMSSDTQTRPRRKGGLTAYYVGEATNVTESELQWDRVRLIAKKLAALAKLSVELNEDSAIDLASTVADEIAYAFALAEDGAGFNGDGTSTFGGIVGIREKLKGLDATPANVAGLVVGTGTGYATNFNSLTLGDFRRIVGRLPQFADTPNAKWYVHRSFYHEVMVRLAEATAGTSSVEIINGIARTYFLGYPVEFAQVLPKDSAVSQVTALLGDLRMGSMLGDRRDVTLALSEHAAFTTDELTLRGTQRFDINVHDVGNASATAANRTPGPIVGLITASS